MLINDCVNYIGLQRTALICVNKELNANKYYIVQLERTKDGEFRITFKYAGRGRKPKILTELRNDYRVACDLYNKKIKHLKNNRDYREVEFTEIMQNDTNAFFDYSKLEMID